MIVRVGLAILFAFAVLITLAMMYLPPWGVALTVLACMGGIYLFFRIVFRRILEGACMMPFKAKGAVLKGAKVVVHEVRPIPTPPSPDEDVIPMTDPAMS